MKKIKDLQRQIIRNDVSDRWRIGKYLHDDLGQSLASTQMILKGLRTKLAAGEKEFEKDIDKLLKVVSQSMEEVRNFSHQMVPQDLEEKEIAQAFHTVAERLEENYGFHCELEYDSTVDKLENLELATHLYRIVQEAAKNAVVHGNAERVKITLQSDDKYLNLYIADNGTGFSENAEKKPGMGINLMRHRMELIGGSFEIKNRSEIGSNGATILCRVPVEKVGAKM